MNELPNYCSGCGAPFTACVQTDPQCVTRMLTLNEADEIERLTNELRNAKEQHELCEDELREAREALSIGLLKYGQHLPECTEVPLFCDCGLLEYKQAATEQGESNE